MDDIRIFKDGHISYEPVLDSDDGLVIMKNIHLNDKNSNSIYVGDILYNKRKDAYHTIFEVPGGFAIESNPVAFGIYDPNDPFPIWESTADQQTSSYISSNCEVVGNIYENVELYSKIKDEYKLTKDRIMQK